jgi:nascent polypeptide-associated complex subunit beta
MADAMEEARKAMIAKRFGGQASVQVGGKGSIRRKKKAPPRANAADNDKKLTTTLKKLGATAIPHIEEVNLFREDGRVVHFNSPKVQASITANTYVISGNSETKTLQELLPSIVSQLGVDNLSQLQSLAGQAGMAGMGGAQQGGGAASAVEEEDDDDDDDVPALSEHDNFEEISETD